VKLDYWMTFFRITLEMSLKGGSSLKYSTNRTLE
jgi:hypothetical protein